MKFWQSILRIAIVLLAVAASAYAQETVRVGVIQSLTGIAALYGNSNLRAYKLAAADIEKQENIKVELVLEDDQTTPSKSVSAWHALKSKNVVAVLGATWDFTTNPLMPLAAQDKIATVSTSCLLESIALEKAQGFGFCAGESVDLQMKPIDELLTSTRFANAGILYANNSWGEVQRAAYRRLLEKHQIPILQEVSSVSFDANDWSSVVTKLVNSKPELLLLAVNQTDVETLLRRLSEQKLKTRFVASMNAYDAWLSSTHRELFDGLCFTYPWQQLGEGAPLAVRFQKEFQEPPIAYADRAYDALWLIVKAHQAAKVSHRSLAEELQQVSHAGLAGNYRFSPTLSLTSTNPSLVCFREGKRQVG